MLTLFRTIAAAGIAFAIVLGPAAAQSTKPLLPPEPGEGEWIEDTLEDDSLWFASSGNLDFEPVATELSGYAPGRCWVKIVDGRPAWVMYFVPGEILGFEIDTHHFGAQADDFTFSVGSQWNKLERVETDFEEITGFEAKWMRLYRSAHALPANARFLCIQFPGTADRDAARLTEVWLRCRFADAPAAARAIAPAAGSVGQAPVEARAPEPQPQLASPSSVDEPAIEPYIVRGIVIPPPPMEFLLQLPVPDFSKLPPVEIPAPVQFDPVTRENDYTLPEVEAETVIVTSAPPPLRTRHRGPPSK